MIHGQYTDKEIELFKDFVKTKSISCSVCNNGTNQWIVSYAPGGCIRCAVCDTMLPNEIMENVIKPYTLTGATTNWVKPVTDSEVDYLNFNDPAPYGHADFCGETLDGVKLDNGKVIASLIWEFSLALTEVAKVGMSGLAKGYKRGSWKTVPDALNRYNDAFTRHQLEEGEGKLHDEESGLLTAAHTAWNALARLHFIILAERAHKKSRRATVLDLVQDKKGGSLG